MLNSGDIGFMIIAATYVFLMTPGLAFFYGGLAQRKNVLNTMMMSVAFMGLSSVLWVLCGYSLSFSGDLGGVIGNLKWFALSCDNFDFCHFCHDYILPFLLNIKSASDKLTAINPSNTPLCLI